MKDFQVIIKIKNQANQFKKQRHNLILFSVPGFLFISLLLIYFGNNNLKINLAANDPLVINFPDLRMAPYPTVNSVLGIKVENESSSISPNISALAAIIVDDDSKVTLFSKNENLRFSMASTTKIMTALTALDYFKPYDVITIKTVNVEGAVVGFKLGENIFFEDMLYALLLPSGNDAAYALAQNYPGGEVKFVKKMNENASRFNLYNTHYQDPAGLMDEGDYTTAKDLVRLASIALKNSTFSKIVSTQSKIIENVEGTQTYYLINLNKLLGEDGVNGVKTGFTDEAGGVLVSSRIKNGHKIIVVVMKSEDRFTDTKELLNFVSDVKYTYINKKE